MPITVHLLNARIQCPYPMKAALFLIFSSYPEVFASKHKNRKSWAINVHIQSIMCEFFSHPYPTFESTAPAVAFDMGIG